jgi:Acetyltransferase (GNAT) domain
MSSSILPDVRNEYVAAAPGHVAPDQRLIVDESVKSIHSEVEVAVKVARTREEVLALRPIWEKLQAHPNTDLDFYLEAIDSLGGVLRPHVLLLKREGIPQSILVGRIDDVWLESRIGYKVIHRSRIRRLTILHGGLLGDFRFSNATALMQTLVSELTCGEADAVWFNCLRSDSPMYEAAKNSSGALFADHFQERGLHWRAHLSASYPKFLSGLTSKTRNNRLRHSNRLLHAHGSSLEVKCLQTPNDLDQILNETEQVASQTYHRSLGVGFAKNTETERLIKLALAQGWFRCYFLYLNAKPCAFWHGMLYRSTFFTGNTGTDPTYREFGLGTYLLMKIFEDLCTMGGVEGVDFGLGDAQYKRELCDENWAESSLYVFAPTFRGLMLNLVRTPIMFADSAGRRVLERTQLMQRIKRAWRLHIEPEKGTRAKG